MADVKVSYTRCSMYVLGLALTCPACGTLVNSGDRHECETPRDRKPVVRKKAKVHVRQ